MSSLKPAMLAARALKNIDEPRAWELSSPGFEALSYDEFTEIRHELRSMKVTVWGFNYFPKIATGAIFIVATPAQLAALPPIIGLNRIGVFQASVVTHPDLLSDFIIKPGMFHVNRLGDAASLTEIARKIENELWSKSISDVEMYSVQGDPRGREFTVLLTNGTSLTVTLDQKPKSPGGAGPSCGNIF